MSAEGLGIQFRNLKQQREAYRMGMWIFVASEIMLFAGIFLVYLIGRIVHSEVFAQGSQEMDHLLGTINTAILLTSSYTVALAVDKGEKKRYKVASWFLVITAVLGAAFLGIKVYEWWHEYEKARVPGLRWHHIGPHGQGLKLFFWTYFVSTGLHALHLTIGIFATLWFALVCRFRPDWIPDPQPLVLAGIYWHLVDLVWIFLYPLLYLVGGPGPG